MLLGVHEHNYDEVLCPIILYSCSNNGPRYRDGQNLYSSSRRPDFRSWHGGPDGTDPQCPLLLDDAPRQKLPLHRYREVLTHRAHTSLPSYVRVAAFIMMQIRSSFLSVYITQNPFRRAMFPSSFCRRTELFWSGIYWMSFLHSLAF